jgi:DNA-binding NarL/FixJ family response regulator
MIDGIIALLKNDNKFEVIGQNISPLKAIEQIREQQPDVLITDVNMKELSGIELSKKIKELFPQIKILALSMHGDRETISEMLEVGINGYVLKNTGKEELTSALIKLSNNEYFFSNEVTSEMLKEVIVDTKQNSKDFVSLTPREKEIVKLISLEMSNAQISTELFISERTVETHRKNIFRKTQTKSVAGLIKLAIEQKII